jgi:hypothetical protein
MVKQRKTNVMFCMLATCISLPVISGTVRGQHRGFTVFVLSRFRQACQQQNIYSYKQSKAKQSHYTPWWHLGEMRYNSYSFLTSALDGGEWSASRPGRALPWGKDPRYPLDRRLDGPQSRSGHKGQRKNPLPLPQIEPRSPGCPVRSQTLY